jgi:hypothetical protein
MPLPQDYCTNYQHEITDLGEYIALAGKLTSVWAARRFG